MKNNELTIEDILDNEELIQEIKTNSSSVFIPFLSNEIFKKLIDYSIKMPEIDDNRTGHKFPFNSTEILCCDHREITNIFGGRIFKYISIKINFLKYIMLFYYFRFFC